MAKNGDEEAVAPRRNRRAPLWSLVVSAVAGVAVGALAIFAIDGTHRASIGDWISDFAQSSGLAGLCALAAASIALTGILRQVRVSQSSLEHQRTAAAQSAWWSRFEWASARAVPASPDDVPLPYDAVLNTLAALNTSAADDIQRAAVGAVTEVAALNDERKSDAGMGGGVSLDPTVTNPSVIPTSSEDGELELARDVRLQSLQNYARTAGQSPARSPRVAAQLYELEVADALLRCLPNAEVRLNERFAVPQTSRVLEADAIVTQAGVAVVVEIKNYQRWPTQAGQRVAEQVRALMVASNAQGGLVVVPGSGAAQAKLDDAQIRVVAWSSPTDDDALREAFRALVGAEPPSGRESS